MPDFELTGLEQVVANLQRWGDGALDAADKAVETAAADAAHAARDRVPVQSGDLQQSIVSQRRGWGFAIVEAGGDDVGYARVVEARTGFFSSAVDPIQRELRDRVSAAIGKAVFG